MLGMKDVNMSDISKSKMDTLLKVIEALSIRT